MRASPFHFQRLPTKDKRRDAVIAISIRENSLLDLSGVVFVLAALFRECGHLIAARRVLVCD